MRDFFRDLFVSAGVKKIAILVILVGLLVALVGNIQQRSFKNVSIILGVMAIATGAYMWTCNSEERIHKADFWVGIAFIVTLIFGAIMFGLQAMR